MFRVFHRKKRKINFKQAPKQLKDKGVAPVPIFESTEENVKYIKKKLNSPIDLVSRKFTDSHGQIHCEILYIEGLVDKDIVNQHIIKNIQMGIKQKGDQTTGSSDSWIEQMNNEVISVSSLKKVKVIDEVIQGILSGDTALFLNKSSEAILMDTKGGKERAIEEPVSESVVRGPRDGFVENIKTNLMLIRRRIQHEDLRFIQHKIGKRSNNEVVIAYMEGIANSQIVEEINRRVASYDVDDIESSGWLEQWIEDSFLSPFPQTMNTERPDKVTAGIMQGKVAILVGNTPFVLLAPVTLGNMFQSPEDYTERWIIGSLIRFLRYGAAFFAVFLPSLYIALVSYHQGMIPSKLAFSIAGTREGVPFPALVEAFIMEVTLELLREAGIRLPKPIGQTIGIVGGLVIGEAAVSAGIVSPIMVIVVAVTAISSFSLPSFSFAISLRMIRFGLMAAAAVLGFYGIILVYIVINIHVANLKSFGIPYTAPFSPFLFKDWKDLIIRAPFTMMRSRPQQLKTDDSVRMNEGGNKPS